MLVFTVFTGNDRPKSDAKASTPASSAAPSETPAPNPTLSAGATCAYLKTNDDLKSALGFVVVAGVVQPGDVDQTVSDLQYALDQSPLEFHTALTNIVTALRDIDAGAAAGDGRTVDTSAVEPDARLLAGICRARGLPIPAVY